MPDTFLDDSVSLLENERTSCRNRTSENYGGLLLHLSAQDFPLRGKCLYQILDFRRGFQSLTLSLCSLRTRPSVIFAEMDERIRHACSALTSLMKDAERNVPVIATFCLSDNSFCCYCYTEVDRLVLKGLFLSCC